VKYFFNFTTFGDGSVDELAIVSTEKYRSRISQNGYLVFTIYPSKTIFNIKSKRIPIMTGYYEWQFVNTLEEAKHGLIKGVLMGTGFNSTNEMKWV
jgi:hypothetical protein